MLAGRNLRIHGAGIAIIHGDAKIDGTVLAEDTRERRDGIGLPAHCSPAADEHIEVAIEDGRRLRLAPEAVGGQQRSGALVEAEGDQAIGGVAISDRDAGGGADIALVVDQGRHLALRESVGSKEAQGRGQE